MDDTDFSLILFFICLFHLFNIDLSRTNVMIEFKFKFLSDFQILLGIFIIKSYYNHAFY